MTRTRTGALRCDARALHQPARRASTRATLATTCCTVLRASCRASCVLHAAAQPLETAVPDHAYVAGREVQLCGDCIGGAVIVERHHEHGALALRERLKAVGEARRIDRLVGLLVPWSEIDRKRVEDLGTPT